MYDACRVYNNLIALRTAKTLRRHGKCCIITLLHINKFNKTETVIFVSLTCSMLPEAVHSELVLSSLQLVLCRVAALKYLPVHHYYYLADYIFWSFGIIGLILSQFENRVQLKPVLGGAGSFALLLHMNRPNTIKPSLLFSFL